MIAFVAACVLAAAVVAPRITKDSRVDVFIPPHAPVMQLRDRVQEVFGLRDPIVILVVRERPGGVFVPSTLALVSELTQALQVLPGIDPSRVTSLATVQVAASEDGVLAVTRLLDPTSLPRGVQADRIRTTALAERAWVGSLVSADAQATTISAEVSTEIEAQKVYDAVVHMTEQADLGDATVHVAGFGAFTATLGRYIEKDTNRLVVLVGLTIAVVSFVAFGTLRGLLLPLAVVGSTLALTVACMVLFGATINLISNALLPLLMALGVANSIHVISQYYEEAALAPSASARTLALRASTRLWRPCLATSITDVAGFLDIYVTTAMPPLKTFAVLGAFGAVVPFVLSFSLLPCLLTVLPVRTCPKFIDVAPGTINRPSAAARVGLWILRHARLVFVLFAACFVLGAFGAARTVLDDSRVGYYRSDEPVARADAMLARHRLGSDSLDIVVEGSGAEALLQPRALTAIAELQAYLRGLPEVTGSVSIVDVLGDIGSAAQGVDTASAIPDSAELAAQYLLLTDNPSIAGLINPTHQVANVRALLDAREYRAKRSFFRRLDEYLASFRTRYPELTLNLTGTSTMDYQWVKSVGQFYVLSTLLSLFVVWLMVLATFRSLATSALVMLPIVSGIVFVSAVMGFGGIRLGVATSLFASIAIGVGVDFAIHTVDKLVVLCRDERLSLEDAMVAMIRSTGRALTYSSATTILGFSVIMTSVIPTLAEFGLILTIAVVGSIAASLAIVPSVVKLFRPSWSNRQTVAVTAGVACALITVLANAGLATAGEALPTSDEIARHIAEQPESKGTAQKLEIKLIESDGTVRERTARLFRKRGPADTSTLFVFDSPANIAGTALLIIDYDDRSRDDARWVYLPGMRKTRRIAQSERGAAFLGTDFTYDEIRNEGRLPAHEYVLNPVSRAVMDGKPCISVEALPREPTIAREVGYARVLGCLDTESWLPLELRMFDPAGRHVKTIGMSDLRRVDEHWTALRREAKSILSGHTTVVTTTSIEYGLDLSDSLFSEGALARGGR